MTNTMCSDLIQSIDAFLVMRQCCKNELLSYFAVSEYDIFQRGQSFQANRSARMQLIVRNADFSAQTIFESVGKASRCVDHDRGRIDFAQEAHRARVVFRDNRVGMLR